MTAKSSRIRAHFSGGEALTSKLQRRDPYTSLSTAGRRVLARILLLVLLLPAALPATVVSAQNLSFGDRNARQVPEWLHRATIYEVWLPAFSKDGNLQGAIPNLKRVADLGARIVYLGPIARYTAEPHGSPYSVADYNAIDPSVGTAQDLHHFVSEAHKLQLKVMLDIVYYHSAPDNVLLKEHPDWFQKTHDGKIARGFWPQPLPNYHNPQMRKYLVDSMVHWVRDFDVDGYRMDVGAGVPLSFWVEARKALDKVKPGVILLSESDRPDGQLQAIDVNYNFQYYLTLCSVLRDGAPAIDIRKRWEKTRAEFPHGARQLHYDDNHDWPRAVTQFGEKGARLASVLNFTLDGIPMIWNGQEVNDATATPWRKHIPIRWVDDANPANEKTIRDTEAFYKKLFAMRNSEPALTSGSLIWIDNTEPDSVLSFLRKLGNTEILVILNLSNRDVHVTIDLPVMDYFNVQNLLEPDKTWFQLYSGRVSADLKAYGYVVGKQIPLAPLKQ